LDDPSASIGSSSSLEELSFDFDFFFGRGFFSLFESLIPYFFSHFALFEKRMRGSDEGMREGEKVDRLKASISAHDLDNGKPSF
jgi:hypothetical protein